MQEREIAHIADDLYKRTVKSKRKGEWTKNDLKVEAELYKELNKLGIMEFYWHMQLEPTQFTAKDKEIVPIFTKYYGKFDSEGLNDIVLYGMAVPGLYEATQFYIDEYKAYVKQAQPCRLDDKFNTIGAALYRIKDPNKVDDYLEIINDDEHLDNETVPFVIELLGRLKVKRALPRLIELLDYTIKYEKCMGKNTIRRSAMTAIGCFRDPQYIPVIKRFFDHPNVVVQEYAAKAIKKMGGQVEKVKSRGKIVGWRMVE